MYTIPWQLISPWHLGVPWVAAPDLWPPRAPPGNWGAAATGSDGGSMYGIYTNIGGILMVNVTIYIYSIHGSYGWWKKWVYHGFRPSKCIKHRYLECVSFLMKTHSPKKGCRPQNSWDFAMMDWSGKFPTVETLVLSCFFQGVPAGFSLKQYWQI